jgi:hypothetical protein
MKRRLEVNMACACSGKVQYMAKTKRIADKISTSHLVRRARFGGAPTKFVLTMGKWGVAGVLVQKWEFGIR